MLRGLGPVLLWKIANRPGTSAPPPMTGGSRRVAGFAPWLWRAPLPAHRNRQAPAGYEHPRALFAAPLRAKDALAHSPSPPDAAAHPAEAAPDFVVWTVPG